MLAGLVFSTTFKKVQIPWVISLIAAGVSIGPYGFGWFEVNETVNFISQSGLVLMMFMAGLETKISSYKHFKSKIYLLSFLNGFIPFLVGVAVSTFFGFSLIASILVGIIFLSSSIAVIVPVLESTQLIKTPLGASVLATSVIQDVASLVLLSFFLQTEQNIANLPLFMFYPLVVGILFAIRYALPKLQKFVFSRAVREDDIFQRDLRVVLVLLFGMVILFEILGLHPIIAGFFTGFVLSGSLKSKILLGKIRAISYGIFIPTFFIVVGLETNIGIIFQTQQNLILVVAIIGASMLSKLLSGWFGAQIVGFNNQQALFFGATSVPQLSTTLAATFTSYNLGLIDTDLVTAMVMLSVVSTLVGQILMAYLGNFVLSNADIKKI